MPLSMLSVHSRIAAAAFIPLLLVAIYYAAHTENTESLFATIDIGIEHSLPAMVRISHTTLATTQLIDIENPSSESLAITLPQNWRRGEVRGAELSAISSKEASVDYRQWIFPSNASVSFETDEVWQTLIIHNPSTVPLNVSVTSVDLERGIKNESSYLVTDQPLTLSPHK